MRFPAFGFESLHFTGRCGVCGWAEIEGTELKGLFNVGLGVTAQVAKSATVGINYGASLGSDQKTHGINATLRIAF